MAEVKQRKKRKFLFNPLKRPLPYLGLMLGVLLLIFQRTIRNYVSDSIGEILVNSVQEATGGEYKITYDLVRFDIISKELRISNFSIELDTTVISVEGYLSKRPNLIDVKTPIVVLKLRSIFPLIFRDQLLVSYVGAKNPEFSLVRSKKSAELKEIAKQSQVNVIQVVNSYFAALEIDSFRIESGSFDIESEDFQHPEIPNIHVGEFTAMLKNFRLDSLSPSILLQGVSATTVELEILKQEIYLPEPNQTIYFDKLRMSSVESAIQLDSLIISQKARDSTMSHADFAIQKLKLSGVDFDKAFNDNDLAIRSISIDKPQIKYHEARVKTEADSSGFYKYFHKLTVDTIKLNNGIVDIETIRRSKINDLSFLLTNYSINREDWRKRKLISDVAIQSFRAKNIEQELPDSIHMAEAEMIVYDQSVHKMAVKNIRLQPISGRSTYKFLKSRNTNFTTYTNISSIEASGFYPEQLLLSKPLIIDTISIKNTRSSVLQYPLMQLKKLTKNSIAGDFKINHLQSMNGTYKIQQYRNKQKTITELNGVNIGLNGIDAGTFQSGIPKNINVYSSDGKIELKGIGHHITYSNLTARSSNSIFAQSLKISPDSSSLPYHHLNGIMQNVFVQNLDEKKIQSGVLVIDTITVASGKIEADLTRQAFENKKKLNSIAIRKVNIGNTDLLLNLKQSVIDVKKAGIITQNLLIDSLGIGAKPIYTFSNSLASFDKVRLSNRADTSVLDIGPGQYSEQDSTLILKQLSFKNSDNSLNLGLQELELKSLDKGLLFYQKRLYASKAILKGPEINVNIQKRKSKTGKLDINKRVLSGKIEGINFDTLDVYKGSSHINLPNNKNVTISSIEGVVNAFHMDTLTLIKDAADNLAGFFELGQARMSGEKDTLSIRKIFLDTQTKNMWTDSINYSNISNKTLVKIASPGVSVRKIDFISLLESQLSMEQVFTKNNEVSIYLSDTVSQSNSTKKLPDFVVPVSFSSSNLTIQNTRLIYSTPSAQKHFLNDLRFDIEIDSLASLKGDNFNLTKMSDDARLRVYNFKINLPDSLNKFGFDTLLVSNAASDVRITNLTFTPRYSKYEYGVKAGFQADWKDLLIRTITFKNLKMFDLIEKNDFSCQKIIIDDGHLDLFKDKQLPYPSDRKIPMLQESIKNAPLRIELDTIEIKNIDIRQTTLQSSGLTEGSITFANTNSTITNITNDSLDLQSNPILKVEANSKIMGKGNLSANLAFDMIAPDNLFFFDARLGSMDAREFNNILEATAFVKVRSGTIKSINLQATANSSYAYGNMSFLYNNLKVEAYNKKNLKTKGMGVTLKSFFANTFVVKKNNSKYKLFGRRGSMYYERDPSRISLDYAAKTALSGVVSSIGARNNSKEIKRVQKEQQEKRDDELKLKKEQEKAAKKTSRQTQ